MSARVHVSLLPKSTPRSITPSFLLPPSGFSTCASDASRRRRGVVAVYTSSLAPCCSVICVVCVCGGIKVSGDKAFDFHQGRRPKNKHVIPRTPPYTTAAPGQPHGAERRKGASLVLA